MVATKLPVPARGKLALFATTVNELNGDLVSRRLHYWKFDRRHMKGPFKVRWPFPEGALSDGSWEVTHRLQRGRQYRVVRAFSDADGDLHAVNEEWFFEGGEFSKFDDELTILARRVDDSYWRIALIWAKDQHGPVIEHIEEFLRIV
jgi:hypothetical protein